LRALRFLHDYRPDVVAKKELLDGVCVLLEQDDMADLAIEDLRRWQAWDRADSVLAVAGTAAGTERIVKRAILRYCIECKGNAKARALVAEARKGDPEAVKEIEEKLERERGKR
jgi:hypothetical protein